MRKTIGIISIIVGGLMLLFGGLTIDNEQFKYIVISAAVCCVGLLLIYIGANLISDKESTADNETEQFYDEYTSYDDCIDNSQSGWYQCVKIANTEPDCARIMKRTNEIIKAIELEH